MDTERTAPEGDISLGRELRRAREVRGITLQQIAQDTKINQRYLQALENDRLDLLPGQPYTGNFVRSIARCIGADEEELVDYLNYQLRIAHPDRAPAARSASHERPRRALGAVVVVGAVLVLIAITLALRPDSRKTEDGREPGARATTPTPAMPSAAQAPPVDAATGGAAPQPGESRPAPAILAGMATAPAASAPAVAAPSAPSAASAPPVDAGLAPVVKLVFRTRTWLDAEQEGDAPDVGVRQPGSTYTWTLDRPLKLEIGNAGGVDMFIDGQPAKPLGGPTETRRLTLDRRNIRSFLR